MVPIIDATLGTEKHLKPREILLRHAAVCLKLPSDVGRRSLARGLEGSPGYMCGKYDSVQSAV